MRFVRVPRPDGPAFGLLRDEYVVLLEGHPFGQFTLTNQVAPLDEVRLLAPVLPSKIVCVGLNYRDHATEMGKDLPAEPLIFSKPTTSVIGPEEPIRLPAVSRRVDHEAELAVVVGGLVRKVTPESARDSILGYTCANDVTARDLQARDGQWTRAKGFDSFCPVGPWIDVAVDPWAPVVGEGGESGPAPAGEAVDPWAPVAGEPGESGPSGESGESGRSGESADSGPAPAGATRSGHLAVRGRVGGELRQDGTTADMIFSPAELVSWVSWIMTLLPGDLILTGTPAGVGPLADGDSVEVEIDGLGTLRNPVEHDR